MAEGLNKLVRARLSFVSFYPVFNERFPKSKAGNRRKEDRSTLRRRFPKSVKVGVTNAEGPPVPIPNTEVKLSSAEDTRLETARENRSVRTHIGAVSGQFDTASNHICLLSSVGCRIADAMLRRVLI